MKEREFVGFKAITAYKKLEEQFGFSSEKEKNFASRQNLFAEDSTPEGYSCFFISNSNWTKTEGGTWRNTIYGDLNTVKEQFLNTEENPVPTDEFRVIFAKDPSEAAPYRFLGVYQTADFDPETNTRTYKRISSVYPLAA